MVRGSLLMLVLGAGLAAQDSAAVTFTEHVAPIVFAKCASCHRAGEAAPFALLSFDDVRKRGRMIRSVTESRLMPPWHPDPDCGPFLEENKLTDAEIATIGRWVDGGMAEGDRAKLPALPEFTGGWQLGKPDVVVTMKEAFEVPASGKDIYRNFVIPLGLEKDQWVKAVEVRPSARSVVHHILFFLDDTGRVRELDGKGGKPGFPGMALRWSGTLGGWAVGAIPRRLPEGLAMGLPKEADLVLQTHFHPSGKVEREQTTIGIHFSDKPATRSILPLQLPPFFGRFSGLDIPPGEKAFTIRGSIKLPVDTDVITVGGHAHYVCKTMKAVATLPDKSELKLFGIGNWDFNWQGRYTYAKTVRLPKGTVIDAVITYDNSADNPHNPNSPPKRVRWGLDSTDEMGSITFALSPADERDTDALARAIGPGIFRGSLVGPGGKLRRPAEDRRFRVALSDLEGKSRTPLEVDEGKVSVVVFIMADCPVSKGYAPEFAALAKDLAGKPVSLYLVHVDRDLSPAKAAENAKEFGLPAPILLDPEHQLVAALGATIAPEAAVITPGGKVAYLGRIDDRHPSLGVRRPEPSKRDLREAIEAVLAGRPVETPRTKAVGCIIE